MSSQCYHINVNRLAQQETSHNNEAKPPIAKEKLMSYEEKSVGSTAFFKCESCPYMALAEDDIKFHLFTVHPELAKRNGLADNIQIPCPGCTSIFDAEETLRNHLRNHHKMGIKDVRKMVKSLIQIALKNAKLKKEERKTESPALVQNNSRLSTIAMPELIEIIPDTVQPNNNVLPSGVSYISVDELQQMSTPNFEKVDPKDIIQEASLNIVYTNEVSTQYVNMNKPSTSSSACHLQLSSVTPDLISSIPRISKDNQETIESCQPSSIPKQGRPPKNQRKTLYDKASTSEEVIRKKLGTLCSVNHCRVRLKSDEKLIYHRNCHNNDGLVCLECKTLFLTVESLHIHLWKAHSIDLELPTCEICSYKTFKRHRLNSIHMKKHSNIKSYTCRDCTKSFKTAQQLSKHRLIHNKNGSIQCSICQGEFSTERLLRLHVTAVHEKLRPFQCNECPYTATRKEELKLHIRSHTGEKPYRCDQCAYRTGDHNAIRRHKRCHTKEGQYKCKYCPYTCIQSNVFTSHMINKHPTQTNNEVFRCPYCKYKSISKNKYVSHLRTHTDQEGVKVLIEMTKGCQKIWTIPDSLKAQDTQPESAEKTTSVSNITIDVDDCDSQQDERDYTKNFHPNSTVTPQPNYNVQDLNFSKDDNNSDCLISESSNDTMIERHQYPQISLPNINYDSTQNLHQYLTTSASIEQNLLQCTNVNSLAPTNPINTNIMNNFPIRLPLLPQFSVRNNVTPDKISLSVSKVTGPIIKPSQILPVPLNSSPVIMEDGVPRKKPKISVKSNLILKGPDQGNMFHSQQKLAFKRLEDNERFGLPVTFNNLITTQFMQLPPEPAINEPTNIMPYPQETLLDVSTPNPIDNRIDNASQMFTYNQPIVSSIDLLPRQQKIQTTDPSYIKLEAPIKQNTQSPSLERMCNANAILNNQSMSREYKASPPLEDINKNMNEIKNEVKSDAFYNMALNNAAASALDPSGFMDILMDNIIGEQYAGHLDLSTVVLPDINNPPINMTNQQNDVIEIDDNSEDNKLLPRYDINFPLEPSLYLMHNDFHFLENDVPANMTSEIGASDMRMTTEVPIVNQTKEGMNIPTAELPNTDFPNFIQGKKDPMMNTSVRLLTNKINVKNIESMKN